MEVFSLWFKISFWSGARSARQIGFSSKQLFSIAWCIKPTTTYLCIYMWELDIYQRICVSAYKRKQDKRQGEILEAVSYWLKPWVNLNCKLLSKDSKLLSKDFRGYVYINLFKKILRAWGQCFKHCRSTLLWFILL